MFFKDGLQYLDVSGLSLKYINCTNAKLSHVVYNYFTKWPISFDYKNSDVIGVGSDLSNCHLRGLNLEHQNFSKMNLSFASFETRI